jgi:FkbM family methyltransferase
MNLGELLYELKKDELKSLRESELLKFIGFCLSHVELSESQNYQDIFALYENGFKNDGFFVEFGATDGKNTSNSYILERDYGWTGILAEPNPVWHEALYKNRSCNISTKCLFTKSGETVEFMKTEAPDLATIKGFGQGDEFKEARLKNAEFINVDTISLFDLLTLYDAPSIIDFLSVDTEGTEYGILNAFFIQNANKYKINAITVEHNGSEIREKLHKLLTENGYTRKFTEISRWDDFYVRVV